MQWVWSHPVWSPKASLRSPHRGPKEAPASLPKHSKEIFYTKNITSHISGYKKTKSSPCRFHRQQWACSQSVELPAHNSYGSPCAPTTPSGKCEHNFNLVNCNFKFTLFPSMSTLLTIIWDVPLLPTWDDTKMSQLIYKSAGPTATNPLPSSNSRPSWGCAPSSDSPEGLEIGACPNCAQGTLGVFDTLSDSIQCLNFAKK